MMEDNSAIREKLAEDNMRKRTTHSSSPMENQQLSVKNIEGKEKEITEQSFQCGCCFDMMILPVSLNCGHSFCKLCLASWYKESLKLECPCCRQPYRGHPQVNVTLRNVISELFSQQVSQRLQDLEAPETRKTLEQFDRKLHTLEKESRSDNAPFTQGFLWKTLLYVLVLMPVVLFGWWWVGDGSSKSDKLIHKPLVKWSVKDVATWMSELGPWSERLAQKFEEDQIDGDLLLAMEDGDLLAAMQDITPLHQKAFMRAVHAVVELGIKPPTNLWEYKSLHLGHSLFMAYSVKDFPRASFLYLYLFEYHDSFLPLLHATCPIHGTTDSINLYSYKFPDPTLSQWLTFIFKYLLIPHWLIIQFTWAWVGIHWLTASFVLVNSLVLMVLEFFTLWWFITGKQQLSEIRSGFMMFVRALLSFGVAAILWPIIPTFICNCLFYGTLYVSPVLNVDRLLREVKHGRPSLR